MPTASRTILAFTAFSPRSVLGRAGAGAVLLFACAGVVLPGCADETEASTDDDTASAQVDALTGLPSSNAERVMNGVPRCDACTTTVGKVLLGKIVVTSPPLVGPARPLLLQSAHDSFRVTNAASTFVAVLPLGAHLPDGTEVRVRALVPLDACCRRWALRRRRAATARRPSAGCPSCDRALRDRIAVVAWQRAS